MQVRMYCISCIGIDPKAWKGIKVGPPLSPLHGSLFGFSLSCCIYRYAEGWTIYKDLLQHAQTFSFYNTGTTFSSSLKMGTRN